MKFNREEWNTHVLSKVSEKYGKLSEEDTRDIRSFLHTDWCQSSARLLSIVTTLVGYGVAGITQIPFGLLNIQLLNAIGLSAGYLATQIITGLTIGNDLSRVPAYDVITDHQLEALFKKADDTKAFIALLKKLGGVYDRYRTKSDNSMLPEMAGFVVGALASSQIAPKAMWLSAIGVSRSLPRFFYKEYSIVKSIVDVSFEEKFDEATNSSPSPTNRS